VGKPADIQAKRRRASSPADIAAEIMRRAGGRYVVHLSEPPTPLERLQLMAARLQGTPIAIMPHPCKTLEEWDRRYARAARGDVDDQQNGPMGPKGGVPSTNP
jgi:hypothetical protein